MQDWIEYLSQSWVGAYYHDSFAEFAAGLYTLMQNDEGDVFVPGSETGHDVVDVNWTSSWYRNPHTMFPGGAHLSLLTH